MKKNTVLILAFAGAQCFSMHALAQIPTTIPGIIDKIRNAKKKAKTDDPKKAGESSPAQKPDDKTDAPANSNNPGSSSQARNDSVRGKPIPGAKIFFSSNPDGSNPKTTFTSSEYIYGRLDLGGRTMYDAFGWKAMGDRDFYWVNYTRIILPTGEKPGESWWATRGYTLVRKEEAQKTIWNFDVLPEPARSTTIGSAIADELEFYNSPVSMWGEIRDLDNARRIFPQNGTYTVDITIFGDSYDDWGKPTGKTEELPTATAKFAFQFSGTDGQMLAAGYQKARDAIDSAKHRREMLHAMPDWWARGATPPEQKLAPYRLVPLIKGFIDKWNLTYVKHAIYPYSGPLWSIQKNSVGIPEYRMLNPYIYIIYKDPKDNSCQLGALYMRESYSGAGSYGEPYLGGIRELQYIDCAAVK